MKIVINSQYGGFSLSLLAIKEYLKLKGKDAFFYEMKYENGKCIYKKIEDDRNTLFISCYTKDLGDWFEDYISNKENDKYYFSSRDIDRTDKDLIKVIEKLKEKADGPCASLKIVEIPDDVDYEIEEYDGNEWVAEKHRTWA